MKVNYTTIEPTVGIGIRIQGADLKELFKNAALAMFDEIAQPGDIPRKPRKKVFKINLKGQNTEELLVLWLGELLSLSKANEVVLTDIEVVELAALRLIGIGVGIPQKHFTFKNQIKAVTYHDLKIEPTRDGYTAQIIFDL